MRFRLSVSIALTMLLSIGPAKAGSDWDFAKEWVGKYPSDRVGANKAGLLAQPAIGQSLKTILPKSELDTLSRLSTESLVTEVDGFVVVHKCRPHDCPSDLAMVILDVKTGKIWVGLFTRTESRVSTRWYGREDDYTVLPERIRKEFLSRHGD